MFFSISFTLLNALIGLVIAAPQGPVFPRQDARGISTVFQYPNPTWAENMAVRANGRILVSLLDRPELHELDPKTQTDRLVTTFDGVTSVLGVTEIDQDVFAIICGGFSIETLTATPRSFQLFTVDFTAGEVPQIVKVADLFDSHLPNGITTLGDADRSVLMADSLAGTVTRVNTKTGEQTVVIADESMRPIADAEIPLGINGIKLFDGFAYFTTVSRQQFCRVPIEADGTAAGPVEVIAEQLLGDDFAIARDGTAFIASNAINSITRVSPDGTATVIAGAPDSTLLASVTACQFGRGRRDRNTLYAVTAGGLAAPVVGQEGFVEGGKVMALRLNQLYV